ncbi:hypothetical protein [Pseudooceanicola sp. LIPI14-2-Ac024]|uniref:hypothetical protein n=1 Tax=Pseudooceanicola sp. LIPI14-2-Ac024 TaxID=3344875 RepID=UPI0035CF96B2
MLRGIAQTNPRTGKHRGPPTQARGRDGRRPDAGAVPRGPDRILTAAFLPAIGEVRGGVEDAFTDAATALSEGGDQFLGLARTLDAYTAGLETLEARNTLDAVRDLAARIATVTEVQAREIESLRAIQKALGTARRTLVDLADVVKTIECSISTARIVEIRAGSSVRFTDQLRILALRAREAYASLLDHHGSLLEKSRRIEESQNLFVSGHLRRVQTMADALARMIAEFETSLANSTRVSTRSARVVTRASQRITTGISALQVGDSFRQRLEHLEAALSTLPEAPAARDLVLLIVAEQLDSAGTALRTELTRLHSGLEGISRDAQQVMAATELAAGSETESTGALLSELREHCGAGLAVLYSVQIQRRMLDREFGGLHRTIAAMQKAVSVLRDVDTEMQLASYNVLLRSMRSEGLRGAMHVVAMNFSDMTAACSACQREVLRDLDLIRSTATALRRSDEGDMSSELESLSAKLGALNDALSLSDGLRSDLNRLLEAGPRAAQDFDRCAVGMRSQVRAAERIRTLGKRLAATLGDHDLAMLAHDPDAVAAAAVLRDSYSVPEERAVHDRICPPATASGTAPPAGSAAPAPDADEEFEWF